MLTIPDVVARSGQTLHRIRAMVASGALVADKSAKPYLISEAEYRRVFDPPLPVDQTTELAQLRAQVDALPQQIEAAVARAVRAVFQGLAA